VGRLTGYPVDPARLGADSTIQVSLLAFQFVGAPLTHLLVAFNWAVWRETRNFFKTLGYPPDHTSAVQRLATTAINAWLRCAKPDWHRTSGQVGLGRFPAAKADAHATNAFGSAGTRTPEQRANCIHYTRHIIASIPDVGLTGFTDGSAVPNPGPCGAGIAIWRGTACLRLASFALGQGSNNIGELLAVGILCRMVLENQSLLSDVTCMFILSDSQLVVNALNEIASPKTLRFLVGLALPLLSLLRELVPVRVIWIPGHVSTTGNDQADACAKTGAAASATGAHPYHHDLLDLSLPLPASLPCEDPVPVLDTG
jgi:ribonuclease HI